MWRRVVRGLIGKGGQSGFTFLEIVLTTSLLAVGFWGGFALLQNTTNNSLENDLRVMASQLASQKIETIIADKSFVSYDWVDPNNYPPENLAAPYSGFTRTVDVLEVSPNDLSTAQPGSGYKKVDVIVSWGNLPSEAIRVTTLLTNYSS